jgi:magnesium-transporting ATPase (P-type)
LLNFLASLTTPSPMGDPFSDVDPYSYNSDPVVEMSGDGWGIVLGILAVFVLIGLVAFVFWVWGIVDAAKRPEAEWARIGQSKALWLVLMVIVGIPATLVYVFWPRRKFKALAPQTASTLPPPPPPSAW